jgi:hypothetical protein
MASAARSRTNPHSWVNLRDLPLGSCRRQSGDMQSTARLKTWF